MEEFDGIADHIFNHHSACISINELGWRSIHLVGDHDSGLILIAQPFDQQLPDLVGVGLNP